MFNLTQATEKQANKDAKKVSFFFNNFFALPRTTVVQNALVLGTLNTCWSAHFFDVYIFVDSRMLKIN